MAKKQKISFTDYHTKLFGERWPQLENAMRQDNVHFELNRDFIKSYYLDEASVWVAEALNVKPGEVVLDMCAAPGGKTLVLASQMRGRGVLICNDRSLARRGRLKKVIEDHLPKEWAKIIGIYGHDACLWGLHEKNKYDKILLDAPCSSERHVLNSEHHLGEWSPARAKNLAVQQYAILCAAMMALKVGGELVYGTCSINPVENEGVIEKFFKKKKNIAIEIIDEDKRGEKLIYGRRFLPDQCQGRGPLYYCKLRKVADLLK